MTDERDKLDVEWGKLCDEYHAIKDADDKIFSIVRSKFEKFESPTEEELNEFLNDDKMNDIKRRMHEFVEKNK